MDKREGNEKIIEKAGNHEHVWGVADGFHYRDGWMFKRMECGCVRIEKYKDVTCKEPMIIDFIDPDGWASIVASVSKGSELDYRFFAFRKLHDSIGEIKFNEEKEARTG